MHPVDHARSSAKLFGGHPSDYLSFHQWFDASKILAVNSAHRIFRHHRQGIQEAINLFGETVTTKDGPVRAVLVGEQHLMEDCGKIPDACDWVYELSPTILAAYLKEQPLPNSEEASDYLAKIFGGSAVDFCPITTWFQETATWTNDDRHILMRHNSFGVFSAEERFGPLIKLSDQAQLPLRVAAEWYLKSCFRRFLAGGTVIRALTIRPWMLAAQRSRNLDLPRFV